MALESSSGDAPGSRATVMAKAHHQRHAGTPHRFRHYDDDDHAPDAPVWNISLCGQGNCSLVS